MSAPGTSVTGGLFRGRKLHGLPHVRPTSGRVREALFSILGPSIEGTRVLDLFAGSGALGIEALSRGAREVVAVDRDSQVIDALQQVAKAWPVEGLTTRRLDLPTGLSRLASLPNFDLILMDPPYDFEEYPGLLAAAVGHLLPSGGVVVEHRSRVDVPEAVPGLVRVRTRGYGESVLSWFALDAVQEASE